jgi:hypothetical protein
MKTIEQVIKRTNLFLHMTDLMFASLPYEIAIMEKRHFIKEGSLARKFVEDAYVEESLNILEDMQP